jgi:hypothetical protein
MREWEKYGMGRAAAFVIGAVLIAIGLDANWTVIFGVSMVATSIPGLMVTRIIRKPSE